MIDNCRHCGGVATLKRIAGDYGYKPGSAYVSCNTCGIQTPPVFDKEEWIRGQWRITVKGADTVTEIWNRKV